MSAAPITEAIQATTAQEVGHKVFAGNLSFQTKDADLEQAFAVHGKVTEAQVIMRGNRSRGYGFVTFSSETEATVAVAALDKSDLQGRQINVELAKPPTESNAGRTIRDAAQKAADKGWGEGEHTVEGQEVENKPKKSRNARSKKGARRPRADAETEEAGDAPLESSGENGEVASGTDAAASGERKRSSRARKSNKKATTTTDGEAAPATNEDGTPAAAGAGGDSTGPARTPRRRGPPEGQPSKTLLFFSNLSFSTTDESLKEALKDYDVVSAVVVKRPYGPTAGRSKGFAFVDFVDEAAQQKALNELQGKEIEGRNVSVKVAIQEENKDEEVTAMENAAPQEA
ncbi:BQ2448_4856 [Microbotryum intermedium]|uniref:BQ2448_4856 protein n=1 Tax=Microbotryum intermedium TaxID=269621 RepID=A0A238FEB4_9BASI|nr:BQ2448_4856 [Microbotryum intermedium]